MKTITNIVYFKQTVLWILSIYISFMKKKEVSITCGKTELKIAKLKC